MEKKLRKIHFIIELCLVVVCLSIGRFEDLYIPHAFVAATFYNIIYVFGLRRKTGERLLESIANIILIWACIITGVIVAYMITIFFAGYTDYGLFGTGEGRTYYGIDAWLNNLGVIIFGPFAIINAIYIGIYVLVKKRAAKKEIKA